MSSLLNPRLQLRILVLVTALLVLMAGLAYADGPIIDEQDGKLPGQPEQAPVVSPAPAVDRQTVLGVRPILGYLLSNPDYVQQIRDLGLSLDQVKAVVAIADAEQGAVRNLARAADETVRGKSSGDNKAAEAEMEASVDSPGYNAKVDQIARDSAAALAQALGAEPYARFVAWAEKTWAVERQIHGLQGYPAGFEPSVPTAFQGFDKPATVKSISPVESPYTIILYATQYAGYTDFEVALPDKYYKTAYMGWFHPDCYVPSVVTLEYAGNVVIAPVKEVGPWNIEDSYLPPQGCKGARRMFRDLPLGYPEAQAAYFSGYNGGRDQYGRIVTLPAGISLSDGVRRALGLGYLQNAWIKVTFPMRRDGWTAHYYDNRTLSGSPVLIRTDDYLNFDWGTGSPDPAVPSDNFSVRWTKYFYTNLSSNYAYVFYLTADDGVRLWIDGNLVVDRWIDQPPTIYSAYWTLAPGNHSLRIEYYERGGGANLEMVVQPWLINGNPVGGIAEYFDNRFLAGMPAFITYESPLSDHFWGNGGPGNGVGNDNFSVRWTDLRYRNAATYHAWVRVDDGIRYWVGTPEETRTPRLDAWYDQPPTRHDAYYTLNTTGWTIYRTEYYEHGGGALIDWFP